jgi:predicted secreted hydrolase
VRTRWLQALVCTIALAAALGRGAAAQTAADGRPFPAVVPGVPLQFPRDHGSHADYRVEWWYITGWIHTRNRSEMLGFQITLFRVRPQIDADNPSAFTPRQILLGHCAIADPAHGRLWQGQRIERAALGLAGAEGSDLRVWMDQWLLSRAPGPSDRYRLRASSSDCGLDLTLAGSEPPLPNGAAGFSRKGPKPASASEYYSEPHLQVSGSIERAGRTDQVTGEAWLDHEWASQYLDPDAAGWDWVGLNLDDGSALMAFTIRDHQGRRYWASASLRKRDGRVQVFAPDQVDFSAQRLWRSPRSGVSYPVAQRLRVGTLAFELTPLLDDQEFDARATAGALYWEGAVSARGEGPLRGRGYLELTGYERPLQLP